MKKKFKLGVVGGGFMASAIIDGALKSEILHENEIIVSDLFETSLKKFKDKKITGVTDNSYVVSNAEYLLFAVKPQNFEEIIKTLSDFSAKKIITIMAGVKKDRIRKSFASAKIVRLMPNTPCSLGVGAIGIDYSEFTDKPDIDFIEKLFSSIGVLVSLPENKLNAVTGVSGSAPAYFYKFVSGIIKAGVKNGLSEEDAKKLAVATMIGSGKMLLNFTDKSIDELISAVCSKGGTTIEAIKIYEEQGLDKITEKAIDACVRRAGELENL